MRILVADALPETFQDALAADGHECLLQPALDPETLVDALDGVEVLVVRGTQVTSAAIQAADALRLVVRAGSGTNTIDCDAATEAGVRVANVPGRNAMAVAELALGLLLCVDRAIPDNVTELRAGRWDKRRFSNGPRGLFGRSIGIVGLGSIGIQVAVRASAFGMDLYAGPAHSPSPERDRAAAQVGITVLASLVDLAARVDVLTLHLPLNDLTRGVVGGDILDALAPGILINTSRSDVVDTEALRDHLDRGTLAAGLDVFPDEPSAGAGPWVSPLAQHPRVVGTHHIGASTAQAQAAVEAGVLEIIAAFAGGELVNVVNPDGAP